MENGMTPSIHFRINAKGNMKRWFGPRSFVKHVHIAIKSDYAAEIAINAGRRLFYPQDKRTNYREPRYDGNGPTRSEHMSIKYKP